VRQSWCSFLLCRADDLWRLLEDVGVTKTIGTRDTHPVFVKPEEKVKQMIAKR